MGKDIGAENIADAVARAGRRRGEVRGRWVQGRAGECFDEEMWEWDAGGEGRWRGEVGVGPHGGVRQ